jgi:hypothetical protein
MKRYLLVLGTIILSLVVGLAAACSGNATNTPSQTPTNQQPLEIVSVTGPLSPINPGGPVVQVILKNISSEPVVALSASLGINRAGPSNTPFIFNFEVSSASPLLSSNSISSKLTLIGGSFSDNTAYSLTIEGTLKSGGTFKYTEQVQIAAPQAQNTDPWPGVPVYGDSGSPITTRVNETLAIVLQPAPLFGWGWQNKDLSAFSLLETKTVPGSGNETNTFGPDAFLFKALQTGQYQITLFVASKPPQQTTTFNITVNP